MGNDECYPIYKNSKQEEKLDLRIFKDKPPKGDAKNHEYLMLDIIKKAFNIAETFIPGNVDIHEPDFINKDRTHGLEMTWIDNRSKKEKSLTGSIVIGSNFSFNDNDAIEWVNKAVETKATKKLDNQYSIGLISLVTMFACSIETWTRPLYHLSFTLSKTLYSLNQRYIQSGIFEEIYIIVPTPNKKMTVYPISIYDDSKGFCEPPETDWDDDRLNIF